MSVKTENASIRQRAYEDVNNQDYIKNIKRVGAVANAFLTVVGAPAVLSSRVGIVGGLWLADQFTTDVRTAVTGQDSQSIGGSALSEVHPALGFAYDIADGVVGGWQGLKNVDWASLRQQRNVSPSSRPKPNPEGDLSDGVEFIDDQPNFGTGRPFKATIIQSTDSVTDDALRHADLGDFNTNGRMTGGGHGQRNIDHLKSKGIDFEITHTYPNGVRIGNIPSIKGSKAKRTQSGQSWFPENWSEDRIRRAGNEVKSRADNGDGAGAFFATVDDVRVGVFVNPETREVTTIFPDVNQ